MRRPTLNDAQMRRRHQPAFYWYLTAMMALAFLVSLHLPRQAAHLRDTP